MPGSVAVNHYIWPANRGFEAFLDCVQAAGADAVGVTARALGEVGPTALTTLLAGRNLAISSVNSVGYLTGRAFGDVADIALHNETLLDAAADLPAAPLCVIAGGLPEGDSVADARAKFVSRLPHLVDAARRRDVTLALEPIHPAEMVPKGVVNSISQALRLVEANPGLRLIVDLYHSWWDPDLDRLLKTGAQHIALLQVSGIRQDGGGRVTRCPPDEGFVDVAAAIALARKGGYQGPIEFEMFADQLGTLDPADTVRHAVRALRDMTGQP